MELGAIPLTAVTKWNSAEVKRSIVPVVSNKSGDAAVFFVSSLNRFSFDLGPGRQNSMDLCKVAAMGHSFGGATVIESLSKEVKFKYETSKKILLCYNLPEDFDNLTSDVIFF